MARTPRPPLHFGDDAPAQGGCFNGGVGASSRNRDTTPAYLRHARRLLGVIRPGPIHLGDARRRLTRALVEISRLTIASVTAFVVVVATTGERADLTGPLTALLVVQASTFSTLKMGVVRVGAVLTGVMVAVVLTNWFGLSWWSLGAAIFLALLMARALRLGDQMLEAPISAMLILAVHGADVAVETRIVTTLIGAAVGMAFGLFFAPVVPARKAAAEVASVTDRVADIVGDAAEAMESRRVTRVDVERWWDATRQSGALMAHASTRVAEVEDSRRLNVWAVGTHGGGTTLRSGLEVVDGILTCVGALFTVLSREVPDEDAPEDPFEEVIRPVFGVVLATLSEAVREYGRLLEAEFGDDAEHVESSFAATLEGLRESRAMLTEMMFMDPASGREQWLLQRSVLASVEQTLLQLDVLERVRRDREALQRTGWVSLRSAGLSAASRLRPTPGTAQDATSGR